MSTSRALVRVALLVVLATGCSDREAKQRDQQARVDIRTITPVAEEWRRAKPDSCPSAGQLRTVGKLAPDANVADPWGLSYYVTCDGPRVRVTSAGPDRRQGTADDIHDP